MDHPPKKILVLLSTLVSLSCMQDLFSFFFLQTSLLCIKVSRVRVCGLWCWHKWHVTCGRSQVTGNSMIRYLPSRQLQFHSTVWTATCRCTHCTVSMDLVHSTLHFAMHTAQRSVYYTYSQLKGTVTQKSFIIFMIKKNYV